MLSKKFRLNLREQTDFFEKCKKVHSPYFSFFYLPAEAFEATVIVSKRVASLATQRNIIKRKFRAAIAENLKILSELKINLVVVVHERSSQLSVSEIAQQIETNVQKIRI